MTADAIFIRYQGYHINPYKIVCVVQDPDHLDRCTIIFEGDARITLTSNAERVIDYLVDKANNGPRRH
jgi:hypothetical protein